MKKIRILVTDDHGIVREGLKQLLNSQSNMEVIGEASDGREALAKIKLLHPDVVLLDITMPNMTGLEVANLIRDITPKTRIVVFSMHAKEGKYGSAMGIRQSFVSIGMVIGPLLGGFLYEKSPIVLFDSSAFAFLLGVLLLGVVYLLEQKRKKVLKNPSIHP